MDFIFCVGIDSVVQINILTRSGCIVVFIRDMHICGCINVFSLTLIKAKTSVKETVLSIF